MRTRLFVATLALCLAGSLVAFASDCGNPPPYQPSAVATLAGAAGVDVTSADWENWCKQYGEPQGSGTGRWCRIDPNWCHRTTTTTPATVLGGAAGIAVPGASASAGAAVGTDGAAMPPRPTYNTCDEFCNNMRAVLDDRKDFKHLRGDKIQDNQWNARVYLAGARYCHVTGGRWDSDAQYDCNMNPDPDMGPNEARVVFEDVVAHVRASVPGDWTMSDELISGTTRTVTFRPPYPYPHETLAPVNVVVTDYPARSVVTVWIPRRH
jgi:hypothetical protein